MKQKTKFRETEIGKGEAIIQLAQIIMILAGFILAISGVAYTNSINLVSSALVITNDFSLKILSIDCNNLTSIKEDIINKTSGINSDFLGIIEPQLDLIMTTLIIGFIFALISVSIWFFGYNKIKKGGENE